MIKQLAVFALLLITGLAAFARDKNNLASDAALAEYIKRVGAVAIPMDVSATGSLWPGASFANLAGDYKARSVGDVVIINIVEQTLAEASGSVASQRTFSTNSAVTGIAGRIGTGGVNPLLAANSGTQLQGKAQTATNSRLQTNIAGRVMAVLPGGNLVIQAKRQVLMNNEHQTVLLRGVARPGDVGADNVILSTQLSDLEVELRGNGAVSEATRRPNWAVRALLWLMTF